MRGVRCVRGCIPLAECERCALDPLHPCTFTADMLAALRAEAAHDEGGADGLTPSRLLSCDRRAGLEVSLVGDENLGWLDVKAQFPLFRGNMVHALMERVKEVPGYEGLIREVRFRVTVETSYGPRVFSGKSDCVTIKEMVPLGRIGEPNAWFLRCKVTDYKSKKKVEHSLTSAVRDHVMQVNMYRWLVEQALPDYLRKEWEAPFMTLVVLVDELEIAYVDMDRTRRFTSAGTLYDTGKRLNRSEPYEYETLTLAPIPFIEREQVGAWVKKHIERRIRARAGELPPPLAGDAAWVCRYCPVRGFCEDLAARGV